MIAALLASLSLSKRGAAVSLLCLLSAVGALAYRHHLITQGVAQEAARRDAIDQKSAHAAEAKLYALNARVSDLQTVLDLKLADIEHMQSELDHEQTVSAALQSDLAAGRVRLSVLTRARPVTPAGPAQDTAIGRLDTQPAVTADLDPQVSANLVGITSEGDRAITRLNACIAAYDAIKDAGDAVKSVTTE